MGDIISIKGVASYHPLTAEVLDITKQNIFVFGLNGAGKSTISDFLYNVDEYPSCSIEIEGGYTPVVYNQTFIDENFVESLIQKGVFTLSKDNADLETRVTEKSQLRERLRENYQQVKSKITAAVNNKKDVNASAIESVYEQKYIIEKTPLAPFLKGFKSPKLKFYNNVKIYSGAHSTSIDELCEEYISLKKFDAIAPSKIYFPTPPTISQESINQLKEPIVGSSSSQLSEFIRELDNINWVKAGADNYLQEEQTHCPFCQSETIDDNFRYELLSLFDKTYEKNVKEIQEIKNYYENSVASYIDGIEKSFMSCSLFDAEEHNIQPLIYSLKRAYLDNLDLISSKLHKPSLTIELISCGDKLVPLSELAVKINNDISLIIEKTQKYKESENDIRHRMWEEIKHITDNVFSYEKRVIDKEDSEIEFLEKKLQRIKSVGNKVNNRISKLRSKTSNINDTINRINENLKSLGVTSFEIVASSNSEQSNHFILSRGEEHPGKKEVFRSLSEGEKTLITFLYFIEKCNGSMSADCGVIDKEKLVVIDDPISSLSQNYIYDIASIIQSKIISGNRFKKVIILTHSLFFFHELIKLSPNDNKSFSKKYTLYRLNKNQYSSIYSMEKNDLKNDYQSLWQTLKDVGEGKANPVVLPNVMRNILEYYFGFVHRKNKLVDILNNLANEEPNQGYKAFYRYINRESHSDLINIGFMVDVDPDAYLDRFRKIFTLSKDEEHFICMME